MRRQLLCRLPEKIILEEQLYERTTFMRGQVSVRPLAAAGRLWPSSLQQRLQLEPQLATVDPSLSFEVGSRLVYVYPTDRQQITPP